MLRVDNLFGSHLRNLSRSLDRTSERHGLLTGNLANANVPGYKRKDIDFAIELDGAESKLGSRISLMRSRMGMTNPNDSAIRVDGNSVELEKEVMSIAESEMRYQMLTEMTGRYFSGLKNVIKEGRG